MLMATTSRTLVQEIDDIRAGRWDNKIRTDLGLPTEQNETTPVEPSIIPEAAVERAEPARHPSVDMDLEETAEVQEPAGPEAEAVRLSSAGADWMTLTVRSYTGSRRTRILARGA